MRHMLSTVGGTLLLAGIATACAARAPGRDAVVLGAVYNLTGDQAGLDGPSAQGARLAVEEANAAGGVLGRPVELVLVDGQTDPAVIAAQTAAVLADQPRTAAFFGLSDTDQVRAAAPVAAEAGRVFLTSGATSPRLPAEAPGFLFLACFGDNVQAAAGAEWAFEALGARTAAVLYEPGNTYTELLHGYFQARFAELGGQTLAEAGFTPGDGDSLAAAVASLPQADMVYLAATPDSALLAVQALRDAGISAPVLGGDGLDVAGLWEAHPEVRDVYFTTHAYLGMDNVDAPMVAFREAYAEAYPDSPPDAFAALGYDAAQLLLEAVRQAGSDDPAAVREALGQMESFRGVTGEIGYPDGSPIPRKPVVILGASGGSLRLAAEFTPEQVPAP